MMAFREVKNAMTDLLGDEANGRFRVVGYQRQSKSADEIINNDRLVQVYYSGGDFNKGNGKMHASKSHDITIEVDMSASAKAKGDLLVLDSETATPQAKALALLNIKEAAETADDLVDEVIDFVYQIIMDARNFSIGLPKGFIASRWISRLDKDIIIERGDLVVKTANFKYTCRVQEGVSGDIGNEPDKVIFDASIPANDTTGAGVNVENDNT